MKAEIEIPFANPKAAKNAEKVLKSEHRESDRSSVSISCQGSSLRLAVKAKDFAALRAALNTYLRLISVIYQG